MSRSLLSHYVFIKLPKNTQVWQADTQIKILKYLTYFWAIRLMGCYRLFMMVWLLMSSFWCFVKIHPFYFELFAFWSSRIHNFCWASKNASSLPCFFSSLKVFITHAIACSYLFQNISSLPIWIINTTFDLWITWPKTTQQNRYGMGIPTQFGICIDKAFIAANVVKVTWAICLT